RPGLLIGRGGEGAEVIKKDIEKILGKIKFPVTVKKTAGKKEIRIEVNEVKEMWLSASLASQWVGQEIEKRMPFRRVIKDALEKITTQRGVEGARVEIAGRLNGADIARTEWLKKGKLPRQTIRSIIDYAQFEAHCTYGVIGVKVWIYKGQKF
ncbi:MAG: 30S ribosomal protein S3, partial [bacterium]